MEILLTIERQLLQIMDEYAKAMETKYNIIRKVFIEIQYKNARSIDFKYFFLNPFISFAFLRRLSTDWRNWEQFMSKPVADDLFANARNVQNKTPTHHDIVKAIDGIKRIQKTYDLQVKDMAKGNLNGKQYDVKFSALDCFAIGYRMLDSEDYFSAASWMYSALESYQESDMYKVLNFNRSLVLELYAEVLSKQEEQREKLHAIEIILNLKPHNFKILRTKDEKVLAKEALHHIEITLKDRPQNKFLLRIKSNLQQIIGTDRTPLWIQRLETDYKRGCRGEFSKRLSKMYCVRNTASPFLKLAPLKMEIIHLDPYVVIYHDVITDTDIADLQELAREKPPKLWVKSEIASRTTMKINQRIFDMTGFYLNISEDIKFTNYGLSVKHRINLDWNSYELSILEDSLSTIEFYFNDVKEGGATVFPFIKKAVFPRKGSALLWYNLNKSDVGDARSYHVRCPILVGSKWSA